MTLEYYENGNGLRNRLVECPARDCSVKFTDGCDRSAHLATHDPDDFGLSPIGERRVEP